MRLVIVFLFFGIVTSCDNSKLKKPDNLISKSQMVDIMVDITKLSSARGLKKDVLDKNGIVPDAFVYKKYNIDSLQFAESNDYYAHDVDVIKDIYTRVKIKLEKERDTYKKIQEKELKAKRGEDSIRRIKKNRVKDSLMRVKEDREIEKIQDSLRKN